MLEPILRHWNLQLKRQRCRKEAGVFFNGKENISDFKAQWATRGVEHFYCCCSCKLKSRRIGSWMKKLNSLQLSREH
jgi:hypothetical protein